MQRTETYVGAKHRNIYFMASTYRQCYFHLVFAVKSHEALIRKEWKNELEMYITGIVQNHEHKLLAIYAMPDHIHIFIGYNLNHPIPDLVENIKTSSNAWIKEKIGLRKFRLRGCAKVRAEALWAGLTYNVMIWIRLVWRPAVRVAA